MKPSLSIFAVLLISGAAVAQPSTSEPVSGLATATRSPEPQAAYGVDLGITLGGSHGLALGGVTGGGGFQLASSPIWVRVQGSIGSTSELLGTGGGVFGRLEAGPEARWCRASNQLCVFGGADLGYLHASWTGTELLATDSMTVTADHFAVTPRAGFEIGGHAMRLRGVVEAPLEIGGTDPQSGLLFTVGAAMNN